MVAIVLLGDNMVLQGGYYGVASCCYGVARCLLWFCLGGCYGVARWLFWH